jgi:site-specific DNA-methyltransferase (adenine-specific)
MGSEKASMVWTDPPYGVDIQERDMHQAEVRGRRKDGKGVTNDNLTGDDLVAFLNAAFATTLAVTNPGASWYVCSPGCVDYRHFLNSLAAIGVARHGIVWVKDRFVMGRADYHYRHENIVFGWSPGAAHRDVPNRTQDTVWDCARPGRSPEHPTMKPIELVARAIGNSSAPDDIVLDPFLGSGTTMMASEQTGRRCFGMEIDPAYADVIVQRWEVATGRKAIRIRKDPESAQDPPGLTQAGSGDPDAGSVR